MAEAEIQETVEEGVVTLEEQHLPAAEETYFRVSYTTRGAKKHEDESDSVTQPLLQHTHQGSRDEGHKADSQTATDGADPKTSVPQELELAGSDRPGCSGSVRSLCSNSSRHECPICSELFDSHGDHRPTLLNCDHTLCHHCITGIMRQAKDPGRLRCPFCRQTTPLPQWEIRRLQEESYSDAVYEPGPDHVIGLGPDLQAVPESVFAYLALRRRLEAQPQTNICGWCVFFSCIVRGLRLMRPRYPCFPITVVVLFLVLLAVFLYIFYPIIVMIVVVIFHSTSNRETTAPH